MANKNYNIKFHIVKRGNPNFCFQEGILSVERAGISINNSCPETVKKTIEDAISKKWIEPVAYMSDREVFVNGMLRTAVEKKKIE